MLDLGAIIILGSISVSGAILEKVLVKFGYVDKENTIFTVAKSTIAITSAMSLLGLFIEIRKFGR